MEALAFFQMSALLINKHNVGVQSCCQLLQDHLSVHPRHAGDARPPALFVFTSSRSGPACSRKRSCTRDVDMEGLRPLPRGVRRAGPRPNAAQLGSTVLKCGIMGELCKPGERAGLFLGMTACVCVRVFGPRQFVKSDLAASSLASPACCPKCTSGAYTAVFSLTWSRVRHAGRCVSLLL